MPVSVHNIQAMGEYGLDCHFRDALSSLLFKFALQYANRTVQVNQDAMKLNGTHQILVYADDVNILDRRAHTIKKNTEALVVASKEIMPIKLSTWSCLEIRMQDEVTIYRLILVLLKGGDSLNIWEQQIKILFGKKLRAD